MPSMCSSYKQFSHGEQTFVEWHGSAIQPKRI